MTARSSHRLTVAEALVVATVIVGGLFGSLLDRALVATPAWRDLGVAAWADYSRHADLGPGDVVYPVGGILWWGLVFAAVIACRRDRSVSRAVRVPLYLTVVAVLGAIVSTVIAAPTMQHVGPVADTDTAALRHAFDTFTVWGVYVRGICFAAGFLCSVWALVVMLLERRLPVPHSSDGTTTP
ncbi:hypothetical protein ACFV4K_32755 [Nocardia sp. NPDC059764]|uniref:hypothetical protein n=1 Tax=Nocardia sp. NPDC059764 TaxID=3346939 RepID=UPI003654FC19